jgi:hypothetical protein
MYLLSSLTSFWTQNRGSESYVTLTRLILDFSQFRVYYVYLWDIIMQLMDIQSIKVRIAKDRGFPPNHIIYSPFCDQSIFLSFLTSFRTQNCSSESYVTLTRLILDSSRFSVYYVYLVAILNRLIPM